MSIKYTITQTVDRWRREGQIEMAMEIAAMRQEIRVERSKRREEFCSRAHASLWRMRADALAKDLVSMSEDGDIDLAAWPTAQNFVKGVTRRWRSRGHRDEALIADLVAMHEQEAIDFALWHSAMRYVAYFNPEIVRSFGIAYLRPSEREVLDADLKFAA